MKRLLLALPLALALLAVARPARAQITETALLDTLQHTAFQYFWNEANPVNGLVKDRSTSGSPASIAATGFGLSAMCIGADHGWITRAQARDRVRVTLNTFWTGPQSSLSGAYIGNKGLFYHFLDMNTATRAWSSELSTIDTALLFAGILDARQYFAGADTGEVAIRALADSITRRADWNFMRNLKPYIYMGWKPTTEGGFSGFGGWTGYNEGLLLYILALGSPTHQPPPANAWAAWTGGYAIQTWYGHTFAICPPLFTHQYPACWIDFRDKRDAYMRNLNSDYYQNSVNASLAQVAYCSFGGPYGFYSDSLWGITASDDPTGYVAHGVPPVQSDNGTISPTAGLTAIVHVPTDSKRFARNLWNNFRNLPVPTLSGQTLWGPYGFRDAFNLVQNWVGTDYLGIDQGPILLAIENYRTGRVWARMMANADVQRGLAAADFQPWVLDAAPPAARAGLALAAPAPDPARGATTLRFTLPHAGHVRLALYDIAGREAVRVLDGERAAGDHSATADVSALPSGVYLARLESAGAAVTRRCVVLR